MSPAVIIALIVFATRIFAPQDIFPALFDKPLVPAMTALLYSAVAVSVVRKKTVLRLPPHLWVQIGLLLLAALSVAINDGVGEGLSVLGLSSLFFQAIVFLIPYAVVIDRFDRFRWFAYTILVTMLSIGAITLTQLSGIRQCGEWSASGFASASFQDYMHLKMDGRRCSSDAECYDKPPKASATHTGPRLFRCERMGWLGIPTDHNRSHWVGIYFDSVAFAGTLAMCIPLVIAIFWGVPGVWRRIAWPVWVLLFIIPIRTTESRSGIIALAVGGAVTLAGLWLTKPADAKAERSVRWDKRIALSAALAVMVGVSLYAGVRNVTRTDSSDRFRRDAMRVGYQLWWNHPILGVGYGHFTDFHIIGPHNCYIETAAETGTLGLWLFTLAAWANLKGAIGGLVAARRAGHRELQRWAVGVLGTTVAGTVALTLLLHGFDTLSWLLVVLVNATFTRAVRFELPGYRFQLGYRDMLWCVPAAVAILGLVYLGMLTSYTLK